MLKHYIHVAWRSLRRNQLYSAINIGGLTIGMTVALIIGLWIHSEYQFDRSFKNYPQIVDIVRLDTIEGQVEGPMTIPVPLSQLLKTKYHQYFEHIVLTRQYESHILSNGDKPLSFTGLFMDQGAGDMLSLEMRYGHYNQLTDPNTLLISQSAAKAFFGIRNPVGQSLKVDNEYSVKIVGVYEDFSTNSSFSGQDFIAPWSQYLAQNKWVQDASDDWGNNSFELFAQLKEGLSYQSVNQALAQGLPKEQIQNLQAAKSTFRLLPMADWHLRNNYENGIQTGGLITQIRLFTLIGLLVLLIACANFMNLSTARNDKKAKEVGIRKAIGSGRQQLIQQFYFEAFIISLLAALVALLATWIALPWFNHLYETSVSIPWENPIFWIAFMLFILFTTLIAGSYPAFYLSAVSAMRALKGRYQAGKNAGIFRKVLIVGQFSISLILIIATITIYKQIKFAENRQSGYDKDHLLNIRMKTPDFSANYDVIRHELIQSGAILDMTASSSPVTEIWSYNDNFDWEGKDPTLAQRYGTIWVKPSYGKTINWQITAGRDFSDQRPGDTLSILLNEAAVQYMQLKNPIGTRIRQQWGTDTRTFEIVGVVEDMITSSPYSPTTQTLYFMSDHADYNCMILKLNAAMGTQNALAAVEKTFKKYIPEAPFSYNFVDQTYARKFAEETKIGTLAGLFSTLAIFICCIGLFGLASFMTEQRIKEIGIRKVLGASVTQLWLLLCKNFLYLVGLSAAVAIPAGWLLMHQWLAKYSYRTTIDSWLLITPALFAVLIALGTVSWHAIRAARTNPVKTLKTE